ncbi:MAG: sigma-70 family RNA polymerase sigma factor, partial [bacterium]
LDVMPNENAPNTDNPLIRKSLYDEVERTLSTLTAREKAIVKHFFGIGVPDLTLEEIGNKFGLTRERVRQIKEKAIRKLRHRSRSKLLKAYLG